MLSHIIFLLKFVGLFLMSKINWRNMATIVKKCCDKGHILRRLCVSFIMCKSSHKICMKNFISLQMIFFLGPIKMTLFPHTDVECLNNFLMAIYWTFYDICCLVDYYLNYPKLNNYLRLIFYLKHLDWK